MVLGKIICSQIRVIEWRRDCDFQLQGNMDIWRLYVPDIISDIDKDMYFLSSEELTKSNEFVKEIDKIHFIIGRIYLRKLMSNYLQISPENIRFAISDRNKPFVTNFRNFEFNISYSSEYLIIGVSNRWSVGVDIEIMDEKIDLYNIIYSTMSQSEVSSILNSEFPREVFYRHWTRKEALLKGVGIGALNSLKEISCCDGQNLVPLELSSFASHWVIRSFTMDNKYSISLAHDAAIRVIRFFEISNSDNGFKYRKLIRESV